MSLTSMSPAAVQDALWQHAARHGGDRLYTILDGARDDRIYPNVLLSESRYECLYRGNIPETLAAAAPYLLELRPGTAFSNWLFRHGWGNSWGIFLAASVRLPELQHHFRRFLTVKDEQGKRLYFRYYDPRVLRTYLPTCTRQEFDFVFGPVDAFLMEGETPDRLITYTRNDYGAVVNGGSLPREHLLP